MTTTEPDYEVTRTPKLDERAVPVGSLDTFRGRIKLTGWVDGRDLAEPNDMLWGGTYIVGPMPRDFGVEGLPGVQNYLPAPWWRSRLERGANTIQRSAQRKLEANGHEYRPELLRWLVEGLPEFDQRAGEGL